MRTIIKEYTYKSDELYDDILELDELQNTSVIEDDLTLFVFDGCHKIYLVEDQDDIEDVKKSWGEDTTFYNIDELPTIWDNSCSLRFISNWKLTKKFVRQFHGAKIEFEEV